MAQKEINESWRFWKEIILKRDGSVNISQLKKELPDYSFVLEQIPKVYCHITGDTLSKVNYESDTVISVSDDYFNKRQRENIEEMFSELREHKIISQKVYNTLMENIDVYF